MLSMLQCVWLTPAVECPVSTKQKQLSAMTSTSRVSFRRRSMTKDRSGPLCRSTTPARRWSATTAEWFTTETSVRSARRQCPASAASWPFAMFNCRTANSTLARIRTARFSRLQHFFLWPVIIKFMLYKITDTVYTTILTYEINKHTQHKWKETGGMDGCVQELSYFPDSG